MRKEQNNNHLHVPVLLDSVLRLLEPMKGESYLDLTAGYGGHAAEVVKRTGTLDRAVLVDRDENAIAELKERFGEAADIRHEDFLSASKNLLAEGAQFDIILADLGVSSPHLNEVSRGFSFVHDAPLDMRMDQSQGESAYDVVNTWTEDELRNILRTYGEEPKAGRIAQLITDNRPINTTTELAEIVKRAWPGHSKVHPATRTFQAIRIAVNDELVQLEQALPIMLELLAPGGRLGIISFHSLEDRIVKRFLSEQGGDRYDAKLQAVTRRPEVAGPQEIVSNPRSRSAKLRVAVKTKN